ncbi:MAG: P-loop NTPase [Desulfuromonadales bacterium]|nr:P-loop NTPase [Desulfuromonadales bacterium]
MSKKTECLGRPIIMVSGDKGGVGKSTVAVNLIEWLLGSEDRISLIDTDLTNPDVHAIYKKEPRINTVRPEDIDIDETDAGGWIQLAKFANSNPEILVINMKAGSKLSLDKYHDNVVGMFEAINRPLILVWVLNIQRQSVVLLLDALENLPKLHSVIAVKNLKNGFENEFFLWDEKKKTNEALVNANITEILFPRVHASISIKVIDEKHRINDLLNDMSYDQIDKANLKKWHEQSSRSFNSVKEKMAL